MHRVSLFLISLFTLCLSLVTPVFAQSQVNGYLFYGDGCPHCAKEKQFLNKISNKYPSFQLHEFEIYYDQSNIDLMQKVGEVLNVETGGVPFLIIGDKHFIGFAEGLVEKQIENQIKNCLTNVCNDSVSQIVDIDNQLDETKSASSQATLTKDNFNNAKTDSAENMISLPFIGHISVSKFSLPMLTVVLALLDGFNPCAMWTLLFLISLLLGMNDRKRMWILGTTFIFTSASVYFLFLSAWLNVFLILGFVVWVRLGIGLVALIAGWYYLKDYFVNKKGGCKVMGNEKRQKVFEKLKEITLQKQLGFALIGIVLLAISVNLVELICSAGLPAIYTQVLSMSQLSGWQYYLYLLLYIFIFMLDDLFVFVTAMLTLQAVGVQSKYARYSHLIGGILMVIIGLLLVFKPEWLMFG